MDGWPVQRSSRIVDNLEIGSSGPAARPFATPFHVDPDGAAWLRTRLKGDDPASRPNRIARLASGGTSELGARANARGYFAHAVLPETFSRALSAQKRNDEIDQTALADCSDHPGHEPDIIIMPRTGRLHARGGRMINASTIPVRPHPQGSGLSRG